MWSKVKKAFEYTGVFGMTFLFWVLQIIFLRVMEVTSAKILSTEMCAKVPDGLWSAIVDTVRGDASWCTTASELYTQASRASASLWSIAGRALLASFAVRFANKA